MYFSWVFLFICLICILCKPYLLSYWILFLLADHSGNRNLDSAISFSHRIHFSMHRRWLFEHFIIHVGKGIRHGLQQTWSITLGQKTNSHLRKRNLLMVGSLNKRNDLVHQFTLVTFHNWDTWNTLNIYTLVASVQHRIGLSFQLIYNSRHKAGRGKEGTAWRLLFPFPYHI